MEKNEKSDCLFVQFHSLSIINNDTIYIQIIKGISNGYQKSTNKSKSIKRSKL